MIDFLVALFESVPHSVATVFIAALPIAELRGAIPIAIGVRIRPRMAEVAKVMI